MPVVNFTAHLDGVAPPDPVMVKGACVREALMQVFTEHPRLQSYVFDDQDRLRKHVAIFVNAELIRGDRILETPVGDDTEIHVLQALSGG